MSQERPPTQVSFHIRQLVKYSCLEGGHERKILPQTPGLSSVIFVIFLVQQVSVKLQFLFHHRIVLWGIWLSKCRARQVYKGFFLRHVLVAQLLEGEGGRESDILGILQCYVNVDSLWLQTHCSSTALVIL